MLINIKMPPSIVILTSISMIKVQHLRMVVRFKMLIGWVVFEHAYIHVGIQFGWKCNY